MTTKVTVHAAHGWPVDVLAIGTGAAGGSPAGHRNFLARVQPGSTFDAYATSSQDIVVHEVQPAELAAEAETREHQEAL